MLLVLTRADGAVLPGRVRVRVSYSRFAAEYGGGYGVRLALFAMPDCALTTPSRRSCRGMAPVRFASDSKSETIAATLRAAPGWEPDGKAGPLVYAIASTTSGGAGDYKATSLSPSSLWQAGPQTGDFAWSYPLRVPPAIGGQAPSLSLSYDSGGTDGETAQSNSQPGQLGEGFSLAGAGGFIERKYTSCADLIKAGDTNTGQPGYERTGDQCWDGLNAYISSAGHSGQLGQGSTDFLATQPGDIFVTDVGPGASAGQLERLGIFGARQNFAIQFSQESAILQGIRPVMVREGIYTIPGGSSFGPDFLYNVLRLR
jgi:hypothetical protein